MRIRHARELDAWSEGFREGVTTTLAKLSRVADKQPLTGNDIRRMLAAYVETTGGR